MIIGFLYQLRKFSKDDDNDEESNECLDCICCPINCAIVILTPVLLVLGLPFLFIAAICTAIFCSDDNEEPPDLEANVPASSLDPELNIPPNHDLTKPNGPESQQQPLLDLPPTYEQCTPNLSRSVYPWIDPGLNLEPIHDQSTFSGNDPPSDGVHEQDDFDQIDKAIHKDDTNEDETYKYDPAMSMENTLQGDSNMNPVEPGDISSNDLVFPTPILVTNTSHSSNLSGTDLNAASILSAYTSDYNSRNPDPYSDYSSRNPDPYDNVIE